MESHLYIPGLDSICWACGTDRILHPEFVYRTPVVRRPARIDRVMGGQLPKFEVRS